MWLFRGILAGLVAGLGMGLVSLAINGLGLSKSNLMLIDGGFLTKTLKRDASRMVVYVLGGIVHALTSITFGIGYVIIARVAGFKAGSLATVAIYVFGLWLAMLFTALPVAGQGVMGNKLGRFVWAEQLFLHFVYATIFWWMLRLM